MGSVCVAPLSGATTGFAHLLVMNPKNYMLRSSPKTRKMVGYFFNSSKYQFGRAEANPLEVTAKRCTMYVLCKYH